ncbi:MAG: hypothetical protein HN392_11670 [Anaerolineae bacterium]|nr:hypothetical protein [Anaerolineae bacterium]MBT7783069.1 hypothetical protein [Anaerolineae bacterium]
MNKFPSLVVFLLTLILISCSPAPKEESTPTPDITPSTLTPTEVPFESMAMILLEEGEALNIHLEPNEESAIIESLVANAVQVLHTGEGEINDEVLWAEIKASTTGPGWVQARYLTEYIPPQDFCLDTRISFLLDDFKIALENEDSQLFASLVSPTHGLDLRYYRYGTLANYTSQEATWAFKSEYAINWGNEPGSGFAKVGTFNEIPLPILKEVFSANYELYCNDAGIAATFALEPWPFEYKNINFYQVFKPGTEQYGGIDWQSWLVGVEYIDAEPYLFALIHFEWAP